VVFDSPPVAVVTDAAVLSQEVDSVVMVVRAFKTHTDLARYALRSLTDIGANVAGIVLNAVNLDRSEYKYGYTYYRRDRYYYGEPDRPEGGARPELPPPDRSSAAPPP
jgi:polysaccharide biosynthesis transport protein